MQFHYFWILTVKNYTILYIRNLFRKFLWYSSFFVKCLPCSHEDIDVSHPEFFSAAKLNGYIPPNKEVICYRVSWQQYSLIVNQHVYTKYYKDFIIAVHLYPLFSPEACPMSSTMWLGLLFFFFFHWDVNPCSEFFSFLLDVVLSVDPCLWKSQYYH